jgi:hypothetical protein
VNGVRDASQRAGHDQSVSEPPASCPGRDDAGGAQRRARSRRLQDSSLRRPRATEIHSERIRKANAEPQQLGGRCYAPNPAAAQRAAQRGRRERRVDETLQVTPEAGWLGDPRKPPIEHVGREAGSEQKR